MNFLFGYIWFRISKVYRKEDKIGITGSGFLGFLQSIIIMEALEYLFKLFLSQEFFSLHSKQLGYTQVFLFLLQTYINHKLYSNRYDEFYEKWKKESRLESVIKGILVIIALVVPLGILAYSKL